jgi:hypothetical protein
MRGHHPESCPCRALQQGELVVDTSRPLDSVSERVLQGLRAVKMGHAPEFLIDRNVTCNDVMPTVRCFLICCAKFRVLSLSFPEILLCGREIVA